MFVCVLALLFCCLSVSLFVRSIMCSYVCLFVCSDVCVFHCVFDRSFVCSFVFFLNCVLAICSFSVLDCEIVCVLFAIGVSVCLVFGGSIIRLFARSFACFGCVLVCI